MSEVLLRARDLGHGDRLRGVDLAVGPGTSLGVIGRSGAGKTTLARLLLGLSRPTTGEVLWRDAPLPTGTGRAARALRRELGYVPQHPASSLDPRRTVDRALREPLRRLRVPGDHSRLVADALTAVGLDAELAARRPGTLSGGQAQRAAVARALVTGARVVVADEPVSGLDPALREQVLQLLGDLVASGRIGLVWISHDLDATARLCDELMVLDDGATVEQGPAARLVARPAHDATRALLDAVLSRDVLPTDGHGLTA